MDPVVHFEMPYEDADRMMAFYRTVFGWKCEQLGPEMGSYVLVTTAMGDVAPGAPAGAIGGGFFPKRPSWPNPYPAIVIAVKDIATSMKKVREAGGEVLGEPMEIPGTGDYVSFLDTEGNRASLLQPRS